MPRLVIFADQQSCGAAIEWLETRFDLKRDAFGAAIYEASDVGWTRQLFPNSEAIPIGEAGSRLTSADPVLVVGEDSARRIRHLLASGIGQVYDLNRAMALAREPGRLLRQLGHCFAGRRLPATLDPAAFEPLLGKVEARGACPPPLEQVFFVNSLPKSGSVWLCGMLAEAMGVCDKDQVLLSHVADIVTDAARPHVGGIVTLVRDLRDVIVSWYHDVRRSDEACGFTRPRYPDVESFYWECFIGLIHGSDRYFRGDLVGWLDWSAANYLPLVRYEDLAADPIATVSRVLNAWRLEHLTRDCERAWRRFSAERLRERPPVGVDYVSQMYRSGHLRRAQVGSWRDEMPVSIAQDIERRFGDYMARLRYPLDG